MLMKGLGLLPSKAFSEALPALEISLSPASFSIWTRVSSVGAPSRSFSVSLLPQAFKSLETLKEIEIAFIKPACQVQKSRKKLGALSSTENTTFNQSAFPLNPSLRFPRCGNYQCILQLLPLRVTERPTILQLLCATHCSPSQVTCQCRNPLRGIFPGKLDEQVRHWSNWTPTDAPPCQTCFPPYLLLYRKALPPR